MAPIDLRMTAVVAALLGCAALAGCSPYGLKGDRGLPPPPEGVAYPAVGRAPADAGRRLRSPAEQQRIEADLIAAKPPAARQPKPFNPKTVRQR